MNATALKRPAPTDDTSAATDVLRKVRGSLSRSQSFHSLPSQEKTRMERDLARVMAYLSDPAAGQKHLSAVAQRVRTPLATAQGAAAEGAQVFKKLVEAVDFPQFVRQLIDGVFNSIVEASIRQMHEYGKFLEGVVKSVQEFASDHVSEQEGRQYLADKFPSALKLSGGGIGGQQSLEVIDEDKLPDFKSQLGFQGEIDLGSEEGEQAIVQAAQLKLARMRQQQLASMVLLGINRIVVTDGHINAKVVFDVHGTETTHGEHEDTSWQRQSDYQSKYKRERSFWGTSGSGETEVHTKIRTDTTRNFNTADSALDAKAKLTGEVRINFKSETFPLEKLASPSELTSVEDKSKKES
jgi:hypothetical protein